VRSDQLEPRISRLLSSGTYVAVVTLAAGVVVALAMPGTSSGGPDATALLYVGLGVVILTPVARVSASAIGFAGRGERELAAISVAVLIVLGLTVVVASVVR